MAAGNSISSVFDFINQVKHLYPQTASDINTKQNSLDDIHRYVEKLHAYLVDLSSRAQSILSERSRVSVLLENEESRLAQLQSRERQSSSDDDDDDDDLQSEIQEAEESIRYLRDREEELSQSFDRTMDSYNETKARRDSLTHTAAQLESDLRAKRGKCGTIATKLSQDADILGNEVQAVKRQASALHSIASMRFGASASQAAGSRSSREQELLQYESDARTHAQLYQMLAGGDNSSSAQHRQAITQRLSGASNPLARNLYNKHAASVQIENDHYEGTAHYNPSTGSINLHAGADAQNPKGAGTTYFHEVGHMIDHKSGSGGWLSSDPQYGNALKADVESHISNTMAKNNCSRAEAFDIISDELTGTENHSISDMFGSMTNGQCQGDWGHSRNYWQNDSTAFQKESFAHMFEASIGSPEKLQRIQRYFPRAYSVFESLIRRG
ncbi:MAG: zinc metallopeptidase [Clostridia bacterium]|nr:zinc metallopeptidase [Clostridia bacterium]